MGHERIGHHKESGTKESGTIRMGHGGGTQKFFFFILFHALRLTFLVSFLLFLIKYFILFSFLLSFANGRNIHDLNDTEMLRVG